MLTMPSLWNLMISTLVFFIAAWYIHRYLDEQGIAKGFARGITVLVLASVVSWGAGALADWVQEKIEGPQPAAQSAEDLVKIIQDAEQQKP
ncbi:MAG: hypothetical protein PHQ60_03935 [Sideroxydans sp.]|nr:hypothetical protein [Sideroxydans sp.]